MGTLPFIRATEIEHLLSWAGVCDALISGHRLARADIRDILFTRDEDTMLNRAAWINGLGIGVKTATIFPGNCERDPSLPGVHTVFTLFDHDTGAPAAQIDGTMMTKWKTAADSVLGAKFLARQDSRVLLIIGAGAVARSLVEAYSEIFPGLQEILVWNRTAARARELVSCLGEKGFSVRCTNDLADAVAHADIVSAATVSTEPVLHGDWVSPGTHVDLIGAYRHDMREADDDLIKKSELFVDARETTIHDIGELSIPIDQGVICEDDIRADLYDLCNGSGGRSSEQAITVYKNGGGAHLDLMTARYIFGIHSARQT